MPKEFDDKTAVYNFIAAENRRLADFTDRCEGAADAMLRVALAIERFCTLHGVDPADIRVGTPVLTGEGWIKIPLQR